MSDEYNPVEDMIEAGRQLLEAIRKYDHVFCYACGKDMPDAPKHTCPACYIALCPDCMELHSQGQGLPCQEDYYG